MRRPALYAAIAALGLGLTACGNDTPAGTAAADDAASADAAAADTAAADASATVSTAAGSATTTAGPAAAATGDRVVISPNGVTVDAAGNKTATTVTVGPNPSATFTAKP